MLPPIQQIDLKGSYIVLKNEIDAAITNVLESGWYILGKEVEGFEEEFATYLGLDNAIGVGSGTDALHLSLRSLGIGPGDMVLTVSHTAVATIAAIELAGAIPVLLDIDNESFTLDPNCLEETISRYIKNRFSRQGTQLKAIIPVHLYGHPADMDSIMQIASRYDLYVIEDCAQAHGASINGKKAGTIGHMAAFSFYPTKNLGAYGDGGMVVTNDSILASKSRSIREYGWRKRYISEEPGMNTRLDELQATILRVKLPYLDEHNAKRREIAAVYNNFLPKTKLYLPKVKPEIEHVYHQYVIRTERRDALMMFLKAQGIMTAIHYPVPVHQQPAYKGRLTLGCGKLAVTDNICNVILSLPMYPQMSNEITKRICDAVNEWVDKES